ncbi:MAG TPA: ABC transporter ATP-binding protein/permease [Acholeplasmataceae bacterium]|nr:ABC transporter ATP-binding protein/permease [Acholeplasmataceae bacterium]
MIKIKNIYKSFNKGRSNEVKAVNDVTIAFPAKGIVTLFGHSGSGKTTILNIVGGLDKPTSGEILFEGRKIYDFDNIRSKRIGYVFQNYNLFNNLSVFDNVAFVLKMLGVNDDEFIKERVEYTLDLVNMLPFKRKKANELSGGQQQRVAIARALVKNPDFIIADEPTGNIDSKNKIEVMNILRKISEHKLVILVTHEESIAKYYSDRIITLVDGKITSDEENKSGVTDEFVRDNEIYLSELETKEKIENENLYIEYFGDNKNKLNVSLIFQDGTLYIKSSENVRVDLLNENSRVKIFDEKIESRPEDLSQTDFEYQDLSIDENKLGKRQLFSLKNNIKVAFSKLFNQSLRGKLLFLALLISGALIAIGAIRIGNLFTVQIQEEYLSDKDMYLIGDRDSNKPITIEGENNLFLLREGYYSNTEIQLFSVGNRLNYSVASVRFVPADQIKADELLYGKLPQNDNEIVITKSIAETLTENREGMGIYDIKALIGKQVNAYGNKKFTISGISKRISSLVFSSRVVANAITASTVFEQSTYNYISPLEFQEYTLTYGVMPTVFNENVIEVLVIQEYLRIENPDTYVFTPETYNVEFNLPGQKTSAPLTVKIVGAVKVKSFSKYQFMAPLELMANFNDAFQNKGAAKELFTTDKALIERLSNKYVVKNLRDVQIKQQLDEKMINLASILTFSSVIFLLSALGYFFINKSEMLRHIYQINVYRSLGVKRIEIVKIFIVDIIVLTTLTSLIGYLISVGIFIRIAASTIGTIAMIKPHYPTLLLGVVLVYVINILAGIIPVLTLLRKSPAEIMRTYDF